MTRIIRTEITKRSPIGIIIKWIFILFSLFMLFALVKGCAAVGDKVGVGSEAEQAGTAIGATIGTGLVLSIWAAGALILGLLTLFTKGKKVIVEERVEET